MDEHWKPLEFVGAAKKEMQGFPKLARWLAGEGLRAVQWGDVPPDWKPMTSVGPGACELRVRTDEGGTVHHRVIYVAKFPEAVYVLHAFEKKSQQTPRIHLDVAAARYKQLLRERHARG
jgi:phage-related protein